MGQRAKAELSGSRKLSAMMGFIVAVGRWFRDGNPVGVEGIYSKQGGEESSIAGGWI